MRVSVLRSDSGYVPNAQFDILLNGHCIDHVLIADDERGEVVCTRVDDNGQFIIDGDQFATVRYTGRVEIRPRVSSSPTIDIWPLSA